MSRRTLTFLKLRPSYTRRVIYELAHFSMYRRRQRGDWHAPIVEEMLYKFSDRAGALNGEKSAKHRAGSS